MKISGRQFSIIIFFMLVAFKVLSLPGLLYQICEQNGYLSVLFGMIVDAIMVWVALTILKKAGSKNLYQFMQQYIGKVGAKIVLIGLLVAPILHIALKVKGLEWFLIENLYTEFRWYQFALPMAIIMAYMAYKGLRNIARVCEIFAWLIIIGVLVIVLKSLGVIDTTFFLPFLSQGASPLFKGVFKHLVWFGVSGEILLFAGEIDFSKFKKSTLIKYSIIAILLVQLVMWCFYGVFGVTSPIHDLAISDISQASNANVALDELAWLIVSLWALAQILHLAIYGYVFCKCFNLIFNLKHQFVPSVILFILVVGWIYWGEHTIALDKYFTKPILSWLMLIFQYIVPLVLFGLSFIKKKNKAKNTVAITRNNTNKVKPNDPKSKKLKVTSSSKNSKSRRKEYV